MRLIPGSEFYLCNGCPARYLVFYGWVVKWLPYDKQAARIRS